jgi:carbamoyltransferase
MNILSINYGLHDTSACILKDGEIAVYFKEERLTRVKRDFDPVLSIIECIKNFKEKIDNVLVISYPDAKNCARLISKLSNIKIENLIEFSYDHHLSHASLAFCNSGFEKSIVVVVDGRGSIYSDNIVESETVYFASHPNKFECLIKNLSVNTKYSEIEIDEKYDKKIIPHKNYECNINEGECGIVDVYTTASVLISQEVLENGKTMGLSSYGSKSDYPKFFNKNNQALSHLFHGKYVRERLFKGHQDKVIKELTKENYKFYADYAYEVQSQTQEAVGNLIEKAIQKSGCNNVCIVGGYGMNVVANYYYIQRFPDIDFYFEPNSDDGGLSIGAAMLYYHAHTKDKTIKPLKTTSFHGIHYDISKYKGKTTSTKDIAQLLYQDKSVAVYTGLAESGQRALGNRSILFNALNPDAKDIVNKIKKREWYRPFAAMVLEEDANIYFDMGRIKSSPFMTICFPVRQEYVKIIPGVTHVDNTCRIQTVSKKDHYVYELLQEFKKLSGHGIVLNTSFNLAGEPLVETPEDAFNTLNNSCLDYLWFEETQQLFRNKKLASLNYQ